MVSRVAPFAPLGLRFFDPDRLLSTQVVDSVRPSLHEELTTVKMNLKFCENFAFLLIARVCKNNSKPASHGIGQGLADPANLP